MRRIIESDDRCADGRVEVTRKQTRASQRKPSKSKQSGRTSEGAGRQRLQKRFDPKTGGRKRNMLRTIIFS